jgi:predicted nucleotidyltransferase
MVGFDAVDPRYRALYERACAVLDADERVVRVEVHGSIADGTADEWSDLDLKVVVRDDAMDAFVADWRHWMNEITPTVLLDRPLAPFIVNAVTDDGLTFDVSVWRESSPEWKQPPGFGVGLLSGRRFTEFTDAVAYAVEERLRGLAGPMIKFLQRGDHVAHLGGVGHTSGLLMTVLLAEAGALPADMRRPERALSGEQRAVFAALPPLAATYDSLLAFELAIAEETLNRARPLMAAYERPWPVALERVAAENLRRHLGVTVDWLRA